VGSTEPDQPADARLEHPPRRRQPGPGRCLHRVVVEVGEAEGPGEVVEVDAGVEQLDVGEQGAVDGDRGVRTPPSSSMTST